MTKTNMYHLALSTAMTEGKMQEGILWVPGTVSSWVTVRQHLDWKVDLDVVVDVFTTVIPGACLLCERNFVWTISLGNSIDYPAYPL